MKSVFLHYVFFWVTLQLIAVPATGESLTSGYHTDTIETMGRYDPE